MTANCLLAEEGLRVFAVDTPDTPHRDAARCIVRMVLRQSLSAMLGVGLDEIALIDLPGTPLRLAPPREHIGLSVSHEPGLSLIAINLNGPVGIDLLRLDGLSGELDAVARDYLGPARAGGLGELPETERPAAFARAWTQLEAGLKCHGQALVEWTPAVDQLLGQCRIIDLKMQNGLVASVATRPFIQAP